MVLPTYTINLNDIYFAYWLNLWTAKILTPKGSRKQNCVTSDQKHVTGNVQRAKFFNSYLTRVNINLNFMTWGKNDKHKYSGHHKFKNQKCKSCDKETLLGVAVYQ